MSDHSDFTLEEKELQESLTNTKMNISEETLLGHLFNHGVSTWGLQLSDAGIFKQQKIR